MFDLDKWQEVLSSMKQNKLRTFLTGFSVAWGIFMLIILLASGKGLENGVWSSFGDALNSMWFGGGRTSIPYKGFNSGRSIQLTNEDFDLINNKVNNIYNLGGRVNINWESIISYKKNYGKFNIQAVHPQYLGAENVTFVEGRNINDADLKERRKVAIISTLIKKTLFFDSEKVLGEYIITNGVPMQVVGIYEDNSDWDQKRMYIPLSTGQTIFRGNNNIDMFNVMINANNAEEALLVEAELRKVLNAKHIVHPDDKSAFWLGNSMVWSDKFRKMFIGIRIFITIIGIMTIIAGIVGVSNIMIILINERKKEIGIRKAVGAKPFSIISLIMHESLLITSFFGYIGLLFGVLVVEFAGKKMPDTEFFKNPEINLSLAIFAVIILIICGSIAGLIPAIKAARIKPIDVLKDE